jgi:glycosyltransferase involved in cell wall biosynthesis
VKVAIVMEDVSRTGGIRALVEMANRLANHGHDCAIITPSNTRAIPFTTHVPIVEVGPRLPHLPNLRNLVHIATLDRFLPPAEIYIASSWRSAFPVCRAARRRGAQAAWYLQADERLLLSEGGISRLKRALVQRAYRLPIRWFVNSMWLRDRLGDEFDHPAEIANPGVDLEVFQPHPEQETQHTSSPTSHSDENPTTVVSIGRSLPIKGLSDLLAALQMVASDRMIQLALLSPENLVLSPPFPAQIIHPLSDAEVAHWYRQATLFIYASWYEGFGLPPLEAMACGVPVVTTNCGGVLEYAIDGYNSLVTPIRDPTALAQAILRLLSDRHLAAQLIQNGLTTARRFTWDTFASQVEQIFLRYLDQPN